MARGKQITGTIYPSGQQWRHTAAEWRLLFPASTCIRDARTVSGETWYWERRKDGGRGRLLAEVYATIPEV